MSMLGDEVAAGKIAHQPLINQRVSEGEVCDILGEWEPGDGHLIIDVASMLFRYLGLEQVTEKALRLMLRLSAVANVSSQELRIP